MLRLRGPPGRGDQLRCRRANATSFAIPLGTVRTFLKTNRIRVTVEPDAVYALDTPLAVRVAPLLQSLDGTTGTFTFAAEQVAPVSGPLQWSGGEFRASLKVPVAADGRPSGSYTLTIAIVDGQGVPVVDKSVTVPFRGLGGQIQVGENPTGRLDNRQLAANEAIGGVLPVGTAAKQAEELPGRSALSDLARDVKVKKSADGSARITDDLMDDCHFSLNAENYARLEGERYRMVAQSWDELVCNFQTALSQLIRLHGRVVYTRKDLNNFNGRIDQSVVRLRTVYPALEELRTKIESMGMCRCDSGEWGLTGTKTPCTPCATPEVPPLA